MLLENIDKCREYLIKSFKDNNYIPQLADLMSVPVEQVENTLNEIKDKWKQKSENNGITLDEYLEALNSEIKT